MPWMNNTFVCNISMVNVRKDVPPFATLQTFFHTSFFLRKTSQHNSLISLFCQRNPLYKFVSNWLVLHRKNKIGAEISKHCNGDTLAIDILILIHYLRIIAVFGWEKKKKKTFLNTNVSLILIFQVLTLIKTCEPVAEMRPCRPPRDWSLLALQNVRTGKSHYLVICRCLSASVLGESPCKFPTSAIKDDLRPLIKILTLSVFLWVLLWSFEKKN